MRISDWSSDVCSSDLTPHWTPPAASPETFGHFGQAGCFLWVDPRAGVALVALTDEAFGDWALERWPALGAEVLEAAGAGGSHGPGPAIGRASCRERVCQYV